MSEIFGAIHLVQPGLTAGRQAGRQAGRRNPGKSRDLKKSITDRVIRLSGAFNNHTALLQQ